MSTPNPQRQNRPNVNGPASNSEIKTAASQNPGASGIRHRTRAERVAAHFTYYGLFQQVFDALRNIEMRKQILLVILATLLMCLATQAWDPPFPFAEYDVPNRDVVCRVAFTYQEEKPPYMPTYPPFGESRLPSETLSPSPVTTQQHSAGPGNAVETPPHSSTEGESAPEISPAPPSQPATPSSADFTVPRDRANTSRWRSLRTVPVVFNDLAINRQSENVPLSPEEQGFNQGESPEVPSTIKTRTPVSQPQPPPDQLQKQTLKDVVPSDRRVAAESPPGVDSHLFVGPPPVLLEDDLPGQLAVYENGDRYRFFAPGTVLIEAGQPISRRDIRILYAEYLEMMSQRTLGEQFSRFCGVYFLTLALFFLAFIFLRRRERRRPKTPLGTAFLYALMIVTVIAATVMHGFFKNGANLELVPTLLFAQGVAIAFSWELALVLTVIVSFVFVLSQANSIFSMVLLVGVTAAIVIHLGRLRSRTKLIVVGSFGALIAFLLTLFIEMTEGQEITAVILTYGVLNAFWTCAAAFLMTGLLPFIERPCGILTDMSLLELGDPSHPLLHELTRRAPATYSHSLQVASIAETAAEAIGARGLLVRVGAYFHDIGKILNPDFFTENQQVGQNVHDHLEPRMSTLVIVSHVKDGVDLVRQHRVPQPIADLVEQHHGTSLVSFFHTLAARQGHSTSIDEGSFRYPGPKPQSKEAGILMIADAAESACRSLRDATPGKIEAMVRHVSEDKLKDGQFDESGLTLRELRAIENSIINSILAMRHNRISYPNMAVGRKPDDTSETKSQHEAVSVPQKQSDP